MKFSLKIPPSVSFFSFLQVKTHGHNLTFKINTHSRFLQFGWLRVFYKTKNTIFETYCLHRKIHLKISFWLISWENQQPLKLPGLLLQQINAETILVIWNSCRQFLSTAPKSRTNIKNTDSTMIQYYFTTVIKPFPVFYQFILVLRCIIVCYSYFFFFFAFHQYFTVLTLIVTSFISKVCRCNKGKTINR